MVCLLRYMVTEEGLWNLDLLKVWLPDDIIIRIVSIPSPYSFARPDRIDWFRSGSGQQRFQMFIWLALKQRLLTQVERVIRGIGEEECCTVCKLASEDVIHVIRDCSMAKGVWSQIIPIDKQCNSNYKIDNTRRLKSWRTSCRTDIWTCLYSDGTVKVISGNAAVGGVIRDHHGGWILGFNKRLGQCSIFNYELWDILDDFALLQSRQYDKVLIWTDNMEVLQDIQEAFSKTSYSTLIRRIQQLLLEIGQWEFEHIPKEENIEVDYITKLTFDKNEGLQLFADNLLNFTS
ncbi:hypothetical protein Gotri_019086 [Gossypium trilobum]|uniref:RNase H type-1 domain-containing protein n=1 Tax=Gossypium trilobum TaxID=34281 RepID=A0A7J9EBS0_9ROSI|nr:hypothetical protein [Gossypium trilobum]